MKPWAILFRVIIFFICVVLIAFNVQLYIFCKQQKKEMDAMDDRQKMDEQVSDNKIKYQQEQIDRLSRDLDDAQQRIRDQEDDLSEQKDDNKSIQTSLVDIKAEGDAIKQDSIQWQKDYAGALAELKRGIDNIQVQMQGLRESLKTASVVPPVPEENQVNENSQVNEDNEHPL